MNCRQHTNSNFSAYTNSG